VRHFCGQSRPIKITCPRAAGALSVAGARMPGVPVLADVLVWGGGSPRPRRPAQKGPLTAMQIRLTVVDPLAPPDRARGRTASCDVLVTAPAGTALAAVASALASAVAGDASASASGGAVVLYAGAERLDDRRSTPG